MRVGVSWSSRCTNYLVENRITCYTHHIETMKRPPVGQKTLGIVCMLLVAGDDSVNEVGKLKLDLLVASKSTLLNGTCSGLFVNVSVGCWYRPST